VRGPIKLHIRSVSAERRRVTVGATEKLFFGESQEDPSRGIIKAMPENPHVLIIEDDHFLSSLLKNRLEKQGFAVTQAFDGEEALEILKTLRPNLIVLDVIMPKVSGFDLLERISLDPELHQIPVIAVSNLGQDSDMQKAKQLGAVDYFVKVQIPIDELVNKIKSHIVKK